MHDAAASSNANDPMREMWEATKQANPGSLVGFQMGAFVELLFDDAGTAAHVLGIALTFRRRNEQPFPPVPMAGVPLALLDRYTKRLAASGHRLAIVRASGSAVGDAAAGDAVSIDPNMLSHEEQTAIVAEMQRLDECRARDAALRARLIRVAGPAAERLVPVQASLAGADVEQHEQALGALARLVTMAERTAQIGADSNEAGCDGIESIGASLGRFWIEANETDETVVDRSVSAEKRADAEIRFDAAVDAIRDLEKRAVGCDVASAPAAIIAAALLTEHLESTIAHPGDPVAVELLERSRAYSAKLLTWLARETGIDPVEIGMAAYTGRLRSGKAA